MPTTHCLEFNPQIGPIANQINAALKQFPEGTKVLNTWQVQSPSVVTGGYTFQSFTKTLVQFEIPDKPNEQIIEEKQG